MLFWTYWVMLGSIFSGLSVAFGSFGAHALRNSLDEHSLSVFEIGVRYQMFHGLALFGLGLLATRIENYWLQAAGWAFVLGTLLFSGSLYAIVLLEQKSLGMITPIGGSLLILGWLLLVGSLIAQ